MKENRSNLGWTVLVDSINGFPGIHLGFALFVSLLGLSLKFSYIISLLAVVFSIGFFTYGVSFRYFTFCTSGEIIIIKKHSIISTNKEEIDMSSIEEVNEVGLMSRLHNKYNIRIPKKLRKVQLKCGEYPHQYRIISKSYYDEVKSDLAVFQV